MQNVSEKKSYQKPVLEEVAFVVEATKEEICDGSICCDVNMVCHGINDCVCTTSNCHYR
jgi:hypothetical protein